MAEGGRGDSARGGFHPEGEDFDNFEDLRRNANEQFGFTYGPNYGYADSGHEQRNNPGADEFETTGDADTTQNDTIIISETGDDFGSAVDPEEPYEIIDPGDVDSLCGLLPPESSFIVMRLETFTADYCNLLWTFFRDFYPNAEASQLDYLAAVGAIFGIDRALEAENNGEGHFIQGQFKKNRENPKRKYGSRKRHFQTVITRLRQYYDGVLREYINDAYVEEKRNRYQTNIFGLAFHRIYRNRVVRTNSYLLNLRRYREQAKLKEQELAELIKKSLRTIEDEEQEKDDYLKDLATQVDELKKKQAAAELLRASSSTTLPTAKEVLLKEGIRKPEVTIQRPPTKNVFPSKTSSTGKDGASPFLTKHSHPKPNLEPAKSILKTGRKARSQGSSPQRPFDYTQSFNPKQGYSQDFKQFFTSAGGDDGDDSPSSSESSDSDSKQQRASSRGSPYRKSGFFDKQSTKGGSTFPSYGHVSPGRTGCFRRKKEEFTSKTDQERLEELSQAMTNNGMSSGYFTETNLTSAALLMKFMDELSKSKRNAKKENEYEIEKVNFDQQDLSIQSFDFNINGTSPEDILGPRFLRTVFVDDVSRLETMRAILQYIVDHPGCHFPTKGIVLNMLGHFDISRNQRANIALSTLQTMGAISSPHGLGLNEDALITPPLLGTRFSYGTHLSKGVFGALGLSTDDKFCIENPDTKPLDLYLPSLKRIIENEQLCSDSAFTLLLSVLKGDCFDEVHAHMREGSRTFEEVWVSLQKTCSRALRTGGLEKAIQDILSKPPTCVPAALSRIQNIRSKMFAHIPNKAFRRLKISDAVFNDCQRLVRTYLPFESVPIDISFRTKKMAYNEEVRLKTLQGIPSDQIKPFDDAQVFKETICDHLASEAGGSPFPQMIIQNQPGFPKKLTISEIDVKPILKNIASMPTQDQDLSQQSTHSEADQNERGRAPSRSRSQGSNHNGSRSGSGQSFDSRRPPRQQNQGYNNGGYNNNFRPRYSSGGRTPMYIPEIASGMIGERSCYLCKQTGHHSYHCTLYPGDLIRDGPPCPQCGAFHSSPCKSQMRGITEQPRFINEDGTRVPYNQRPYVPGPQDEQQPRRPPFSNPQFSNPRFGNQRGPVPWSQGPQRRTTNFNGSPNFSNNPRLFDPFVEQRQRNGPPRNNGNYRNGPNYQNNNRNQMGGPRQYAPNPEYMRDQTPNPNAIGNAGAQIPPPNVFINATQVQPSYQGQDVRYQNDQQNDQYETGSYIYPNNQ